MTQQTEALAAEIKRLAEDMADAACANVAGEFVERQRKPLHEAIDRLAALSAPAPQVLAPEDVLKAAQCMVENDYRGPLAYARKVFDWVAALSSQPPEPREPASSEMPLPLALRILAREIKDGDGLRNNSGRHHRVLEKAADALDRASLTATAGSTP